jgi:hypothetical protein
LFFFWWNTLIYCNWRGWFVFGNCHNLCHWTVSSDDSCTRENRRGIYVRFWSPSFGHQKTMTTWLIKTEIFTLHWINIITRNNSSFLCWEYYFPIICGPLHLYKYTHINLFHWSYTSWTLILMLTVKRG